MRNFWSHVAKHWFGSVKLQLLPPTFISHTHPKRQIHSPSNFLSLENQMSGRGKRKDDDNNASDGGDSDGNAPPKKAPKQDDEDGIVVCEISKNRRVSVRSWHGRVFVDIREFYSKDGKQMPGKKGISLPMDQWKVLREHIEEIDEALTENENT